MVVIPAATAVTTPVIGLTVAMPLLPELHSPPLTASESVVVFPAHIPAVPVIGRGMGFTVTVVAAAQPVGKV